MKLAGNTIHVFNTHGIGDVIMSLPMLKNILSREARVLLTVKGKAEAEVVACTLGKNFCERIEYIYFSDFNGFGGKLRYFKLLRSHNIDLSITATGIHMDKYNLMAFLSGATQRVGLGGKLAFLNHKNLTQFENIHKVRKNLEIVEFSFDLDLDIEFEQLPSYQADHFYICESPPLPHCKVIALAPSSGELESHKRWPLGNYRKLTERLVEKGHMVILLGGPGEEELGDYISRGLSPDKVKNYIGKLSIQQSLDCMHECDVLVANCNGLSHMGSLIPDLKIVGLFGPTNPSITGPYSKDLTPIRLGLDCSPCYRRGYIQGCGDPVCMQDIDVDLVESKTLS